MSMQLFSRAEDVARAQANPATADFYSMLREMRNAVDAHSFAWARHPEFVAYAKICFWAIRKLEYGFATHVLSELEHRGKPLRILHVGCGVVPLCNWLSDRGHVVTAIDPSSELIELLLKNKLNAFYGSDVEYAVGHAEDLAFPDETFDVVLCVSVLEHIAPGNDLLALRQMARVLKADGTLVISFDVAPDRPPQSGDELWPTDHRRYAQPFSPGSARRLVSSISDSFQIDVSDVAPDLHQLTWEQVHDFWRATQDADGRQEPIREYVAMGGVMRRASSPRAIVLDDIKAAYREGQQALQERLTYFQSHAEQRLQIAQDLEQEIRKFQKASYPSAALQQNTATLRALVDQLTAITERLGAETLPDASIRERLAAAEQQRKAAQQVADARLVVIGQQRAALDAYRRTRLRSRVRRRISLTIAPRIGVLEQYPPRQLVVPQRYHDHADLQTYPVISIVTPTLNQGAYIERTINSVIGQHYPALEYVVQDGGSTDSTVDILDRYASSLRRVVSEKDGGFGDAINRGFVRATGQIMAYLNSDDLLLPGTLRYVAEYFERHADVDVVYGHRVVVDRFDGEIGRWVLPPHEDGVLSWADYVPQETLFWRRSIWDRVGAHVDDSFRFAIDWDLLLRFRDAGARMRRLPRFLGAFRVHPDQKTSTEMVDVGRAEMDTLRQRALGRMVSHDEIHRALTGYLRRHLLLHKLYRLGLLRY